MPICRRLNQFEGIVQSISNNKTEITLLMPRGGQVKAKNEGFEVSDHVCLLLDPVKKKIIKVLPKLLADITVALGSDPTLRSAMIESPSPEELDFDEYEFEPDDEPVITEDNDGSETNTDTVVFEGHTRGE